MSSDPENFIKWQVTKNRELVERISTAAQQIFAF